MSDVHDHLPLRSVELDILLGVVDQPRHGYAILQEAEARTDGRAGYEIPTLYRALRRMADAGLIRASEAPADDDPESRRDYWTVTELGRDVLRREMGRLESVLAAARSRMPAEGGG